MTSKLSLIRELAIVEFKLKYQGSIIGYLWSLAKPLAIFGVLYVVFTMFVKIGADQEFFAVYLLLGIVLWSFFAETTNLATRSIVEKSDLLRKVHFPKVIILLSTSISALITLALNMLVVILFAVLSGAEVALVSLGLILIVIQLYILSLGVSLFLAAMYVRYRDISHIWEVALQMLFYASAIIYPLSIVPQKFIDLIILSPITQIIQDARWLLIDRDVITAAKTLASPLTIVPYVIPPLLLIAGIIYFNARSKYFAEEA